MQLQYSVKNIRVPKLDNEQKIMNNESYVISNEYEKFHYQISVKNIRVFVAKHKIYELLLSQP